MKRHVIDTNVLIVSSGQHPESPFCSKNHPVSDHDEAEKVLQWLQAFEMSSNRMILDTDEEIFKEYFRKLTHQDYGKLVWLQKAQNNDIDYVNIDWVDDPAAVDKAAVLDEPLKTVIHDLADTKMVAACIEANKDQPHCTIVNACDTDWYDWETDLQAAGINVEQIIDVWLRDKWRQHHER